MEKDVSASVAVSEDGFADVTVAVVAICFEFLPFDEKVTPLNVVLLGARVKLLVRFPRAVEAVPGLEVGEGFFLVVAGPPADSGRFSGTAVEGAAGRGTRSATIVLSFKC